MNDNKLPEDAYSVTLSRLKDNPAAIAPAPTTIDLITFLGNSESWIVRTIRIDGAATVFLQRINSAGGDRIVLPAEVTAAIARQRETTISVSRRRGAAKATATKAAKKGSK